MDKFYVYKCDAPGCGLKYATVTQPLSCPYCDATATFKEPEHFKQEESEYPFVREVNGEFAVSKDGETWHQAYTWDELKRRETIK